jgi:hypothetical protein
VNEPEPRRRYEPEVFAAEQAAIAATMEENDVPAATGTVIPACALAQAGRVGGVHGFAVVSPSGNVAGRPAFFQSMARLVARIPVHGVCPKAGTPANMARKSHRQALRTNVKHCP